LHGLIDMSYVINPITKRRIRSDGDTARIPAVAARLRGDTFQGSSRSGTMGHKLAAGSKLQVWNMTAHHTLGGVPRDGLARKVDKMGKARIVFRSRSEAAKRNPVLMSNAQAAKRSARFG
jgi:hypothetical protein